MALKHNLFQFETNEGFMGHWRNQISFNYDVSIRHIQNGRQNGILLKMHWKGILMNLLLRKQWN